MRAIIALLRGVNLGGHKMIKMEHLRDLCGTLRLKNPQTYVQSGNVVFGTDDDDLIKVGRRLEKTIEKTCGFSSSVVLRTGPEMRAVWERNPFATRNDLEPSKLIVLFLANDPGKEAREKLAHLKTNPEEIRVAERELYIYYPNGMGKSNLRMSAIESIIKTPSTARNWNTVTKLLQMAEQFET
jgi:uncharacterized protein (DUF1697 family)